MEASHLLASVTGLLLIVIARGLFRRMATARLAAIALLLAGAAFSILKGLDWEEALVLTIIAGILTLARASFHRKGDYVRAVRPDPTWIGLTAIVVLSLTLVGFLAYRHVDYQSSLLWEFAWEGDAPRFLRATLALAIVAAAIAADAIINRPAPATHVADVAIPKLSAPSSLPPKARSRAWRSSATSRSWSLRPEGVPDVRGVEVELDHHGRSGRGPGIRPAPSLALRGGCRPRGAHAARLLRRAADYLTPISISASRSSRSAKSHACPSTDLRSPAATRQPLRYAQGKARREGLEFSVLPRAEVPGGVAELRHGSDAWLSGKHGKEKGFSLGFFDERYMASSTARHAKGRRYRRLRQSVAQRRP